MSHYKFYANKIMPSQCSVSSLKTISLIYGLFTLFTHYISSILILYLLPDRGRTARPDLDTAAGAAPPGAGAGAAPRGARGAAGGGSGAAAARLLPAGPTQGDQFRPPLPPRQGEPEAEEEAGRRSGRAGSVRPRVG